VNIQPEGIYKSNDGLYRLTKSIQLFVNGKPTILSAGQPASPLDLNFIFSFGDPNKVNVFPLNCFFSIKRFKTNNYKKFKTNYIVSL
jgi:hypothetical protein